MFKIPLEQYNIFEIMVDAPGGGEGGAIALCYAFLESSVHEQHLPRNL